MVPVSTVHKHITHQLFVSSNHRQAASFPSLPSLYQALPHLTSQRCIDVRRTPSTNLRTCIIFTHTPNSHHMSFIQYQTHSRTRGHARAFLPSPPPSAAPHTNHSQSTCSFKTTPNSSRPGHPHPARHTTAINKYAKAGNLPLLQHAIRSATRDGYVLNAVNYTTIANAHAEHGSPEQVFNVLATMRKRRVCPTNVTLRVAVKACQRWRKSRRAIDTLMETLRWVTAATVQPCIRSWNIALACLARHDARSEIAQVIRWMLTDRNAPPPDTRSYNTFMSVYKRHALLREAVDVFRQMLLAVPQVRPDVVTYNTLLDIAVQADLPRQSQHGDEAPNRFVYAILNSMARQNVKPNLATETLILRVLCRKDASPSPEFLWSRFTDILTDKFAHLDKQYFDAAITGFGRAADINGMSLALTEMSHSRLQPDSYTFHALLCGASCLGDVTLAKAILEIISNNGVTPDAREYTTAISTCARSDPLDPTAAESILNHALDQGVHWTPAMINAALSSYGDDSSSAIRLWQKLRTCPDEASRDALHKRMVYDALMRVCGRQARPDLALRIFYAAKKAGHVRPNSADSRCLYNAFRRGTRETGLDDAIDKNAFKSSFVRHLKAECGINRDLDLPIEQIRIKF